MRYSLTFPEPLYERLVEHLFADRAVERAAYLLCRTSLTPRETRLIARELLIVPPDEVLEASPTHMKIPSTSFMRAMKRANRSRQRFVFVHSHPAGVANHSPQDDREEEQLFRTAYTRITGAGPHASLVISTPTELRARVWLPDGSHRPVHRIRVIGRRFRVFDSAPGTKPISVFFDRQVRAFGPEIQRLLHQLTIGVVGAGGTGSAVSEQLIRLGVGSLVLADSQEFEASNVNRVYGSRVVDQDIQKVKILERLAADIGMGTQISTVARNITAESAANQLRDCDVVFGCTDDEWGRSVLMRLGIYYVIPIFDLGVKVDSVAGMITAVEGRVTTLIPGAACLFCRERIDSERIRAESISITNPDEAAQLRREGYILELADRAPAIIPFTSAIASAAINELLHRLTGYLGDERTTTEVIHQFHNTVIRTNSKPPGEGCICNNPALAGRGDSTPFLGMTWPTENV